MAEDAPTAPPPATTNGPPAAAVAPGPPAPTTAPAAQYQASIHTYCGEDKDPILPLEFVSGIRELEEDLKMPVWLLIQNRLAEDDDEKRKQYQSITYSVRQGFFRARHHFGAPIALLIDAPGGYALEAYFIARLFRKRGGRFTAVIPQVAKSAATLLSLGADPIIMGDDAHLGPLDAQYWDPEREDQLSALDEVQALLRLNADALRVMDQTLWLMKRRTGKKAATLLPRAMYFAAALMRPMLEKIDAVHFSQMQRVLKEVEDYAIRLLQPVYSKDKAAAIAQHLIQNYSEHGFMIDADEAAGFGLKTVGPTDKQRGIFDKLMPYLDDMTAIGRIEEVKP